MDMLLSNRDWQLLDGDILEGAVAYESGYLHAIVSRDGPDHRWHLSVSHRNGIYPNWDQLADARYDLIPHDVDMGLILPPPKDYINLNEAVLQLHEIRDAELLIDRDLRMVRTKLTEGRRQGKEG